MRSHCLGISDLAGRLGLSHTVAQKTRRGDRSVEIGFMDTSRIAGHPALIVDDIVSSPFAIRCSDDPLQRRHGTNPLASPPANH